MTAFRVDPEQLEELAGESWRRRERLAGGARRWRKRRAGSRVKWTGLRTAGHRTTGRAREQKECFGSGGR